MDPHELLQDITTDLARFRDIMRKTEAVSEDPETRAKMNELGGIIDKAFAEVQEAFEPALRELNEQEAATQRSLEESRRELAAIQEQLARGVPAESEVPAAPAEESLDPAYVQQLRDELLHRYAVAPPAPSPAP